MTRNELIAKTRELQQLKRMVSEIKNEIENIEDEIKYHMSTENLERLYDVEFKIYWRPVEQKRLDTERLKRDMPELVQRYTKITTTRPLLVR